MENKDSEDEELITYFSSVYRSIFLIGLLIELSTFVNRSSFEFDSFLWDIIAFLYYDYKLISGFDYILI